MSDVSLDTFRDNLREMVRTGEIGRALMRATDEAGNLMILTANTDYLRGPRPLRLGRVSGALARSLRKKITPRRDGITLQLMAGGGPEGVKYARVHELGDTRTIPVKQHTRTMLFGKTVPPFSVGPYSRKQNVRARPYLKPSRNKVLEEKAPKIFADELGRTIQRLFTGG
jgi:hypothetical protein